MNNIRKGLLALSTATLLCLPAIGQGKRIEHNFYIGLGYATEFADEEAPIAFHVGYGLNYYLTRHWSVMPGIGYRAKFEVGDVTGKEGAYDCSYIDIPVLIQYHLSNPRKSGLVVECGSVFSFIASNNQYYNGADPNYPLNDRDIYRPFDFSLQPGIYYQMGKHWRLGLQGHVGLLNLEKDYPGVSGSFHFHDLTATLNFHF